MKKVIAFLLAVCLMSGMLAGCAATTKANTAESSNSSTEQTATADESGTIALVLLYDDNQALEPCITAVENVAKQHGDKVITYGAGGDVANVANCIEKAISAGVKGIVLHNSDDISNAGALQEAKDAGIPVAVIDARFKGDQSLVISQTAVNNYMAGYLCGEAMAKDLGGEGNVIMLEYTSNASWAERSKGFEDALAETNISIIAHEEILAAVDENNTLVENLLQRFDGSGTEINGIWGFAGGNAVGACAALKAAGRDDITVYCIDGSQMELDLVETGELKGTAYLNLYSIAYEGALDVYGALEGNAPAAYYKMVDATMVTKENVSNYSNVVFTDDDYLPAVEVDE